MAKDKVGIWLIGARGGVASTAIVGLSALRRRLAGNQGLVTESSLFAKTGLADWDDFVVGGHEIRQVSLVDEAAKLAQVSHAIDVQLLRQIKADLVRADAAICLGTAWGVGPVIEGFADPAVVRRKETPREAIARLQADLDAFAAAHRLNELVVVNVASTEPPADRNAIPPKWKELSRLLDRPDRCPLPASSLYAVAALESGRPYINFTPSLGSAPPAIQELAIARGTCHMGCDGKTGETLLKSVLAPMFARRRLEVMSWVGQNIFGNMDAIVLREPENKKTKVESKDRLLHAALGYRPQTFVGIEFVESLGDWKTAWDHIHFRGFLGTPMVLQFIWQGCDSILAAPLVLDLARLAIRARQAGEVGLLPFLASFFKSPLEVTEHDFARQFQWLEQWAERHRFEA